MQSYEPIPEFCERCERRLRDSIEGIREEAIRMIERVYGLPESSLSEENLELYGVDPSEYGGKVREVVKRRTRNYSILSMVFGLDL